MKRNIVALLFISSVMGLSSCEDFKLGNDFLEKPLSDGMNIDSVFSRKVYAEQQLAQTYHSLPDFLPVDGRMKWGVLEGITDLAEERDGSYHDASLTAASSSAGAYSIMYNTKEHGQFCAAYGIRQAYIFLENVDRVPDMTVEEKNIRKGEAMMIIAYHYVDMFRNLGGMPWIDHAYTPEDDMMMERMTVAQAVENICGLIDQAATLLPWTTSANDDGRMTKAGALALKSRLLTFAASPLFNSDQPYREGEAADKHYVWWGDYQKSRWEDALEAGLEFLRENRRSGDQYALVDNGDPGDSFFKGYFERYNFEILISSHRYATCSRETFPIYQISYGFGRPLLNYVDMFQMKDGSEFDWDNAEHRAHPFFTEDKEKVRDPRLYETVWVTGDSFWGRTCEIYKGGREQPKYMGGGQDWRWQDQGRSGFAMKKLVLDQYTDYNGRMYQCPLMRLPEIYFNIAEAMNELGRAEEKDEFGRNDYDYVNLVRARVDMPPIDSDMVAPGESLREYILDERAREFGYEEVRYFDIVRWKHKDYLDDTPRRLEIFPVEPKIDGEYRNFTYAIQTDQLLERKWVTYWDNKYYLCPIPQEEINKKYGLVQNPGW